MSVYSMKKNILSVMVLLLILSIGAEAQRSIKGVVLDAESGETLIGASVLIVGQSGGTITDIDGKFELQVSEEANEIEVSYTGFDSQVLPIDFNQEMRIEMQSGKLLEEIIVVGYGTIKREDATGSVQSVSSKDFNRGAMTGPQELLSGKVAGVSITTAGDPGGGSKIRIRGESSLNAGNDPLIVIDGVPLENGGIAGNRNPLDIINHNEIETFTVLKDASATAIYGNRAAGGVIIITTKKGVGSDRLKVAYTGNVSYGKISNKVDVLNADEYRAKITEIYGEDHPAFPRLGAANTDWQDEIYEGAFGQEHNINLSGGIKALPYRLTVGYLNKDGVLSTDNYQRTSYGLNVNPGYLDNRLQLNFGLKGILSKNNFANRGAIGSAIGFDPTQSPLDSASPFGGYFTWVDANGNPEFIAPTNPLALLNLNENKSDVNRIIANASADYRFSKFPALRANLNIATDRVRSEGTNFTPTEASFAFDALNGGGADNNYSQEKDNNLLEFYLNYKKQLSKNSLDIMGGYSWQQFTFNNAFMNSDVAGTPSETTVGTDASELFLVSLFTRLNYNYDSKYLLTLSLRRDGTSRFSPENRWGLFPAAALAVKLIENDNSTFNNVKIRGGWGITGQESIGNRYAYLPQYTSSFENAQYQFGQQFFTTLRPEGYDANIKWEETSTINLGVDFSIIKDRLSGAVDVYQRETKDLLNRIPVPAGTNLTNFITTNVGDMENQGIEVSLYMTPVVTTDFSWDLAFNTAYNKNTITKLTATDDPEYVGIQTGGVAGGVGSNIQIHSVGFSPFSFYVKEQMYDEAGNLLEGQFVDRNGDGLDNDFYRLEKPAADLSFGLTSNINYKKVGFSFGARALTGNYIYNNVQTSQGYLNRLVSSSNVLFNVHSAAVDLNVFDQGKLTFSDHYVQDASFIRVDHVTLSYDFGDLLGDNTSIYFTVQNPFLFTAYDGLDPETDNGIDNNLYPRPRTLVFGWSTQF